ncbi:hypothetical protein PM082_013765 [Marasmius tenuissimus]|nr:hypothetical protein PM082_013765 [Marasmius tenuissimus]
MHRALNVEELRLKIISFLNKKDHTALLLLSKSFRQTLRPITMLNLSITQKHLDACWTYCSGKTLANPAHSFRTATIDLAVSPGDILYFLRKCKVDSVANLRVENSNALVKDNEYLDIAIVEICAKFTLVKDIEITGMGEGLQGEILGSFGNLVHLTIHIPIERSMSFPTLILQQLNTLVVVDLESHGQTKSIAFSSLAARIVAPNLEKLSIIGGFRTNLIPIRELVRRYRTTVVELSLLDEEGPDVDWHVMSFPQMPRLHTLVLDISWAGVYVNSENQFQDSLPVLRSIILQAEQSKVYGGLIRSQWRKLADGLRLVKNRLEMLQCDIRGDSEDLIKSFIANIRERLEEIGTDAGTIPIREGTLAPQWPEPAHLLAPRRKSVKKRAWTSGWGDVGSVVSSGSQ